MPLFANETRSPDAVERRLEALRARRDEAQQAVLRAELEIAQRREYADLAPRVTRALEHLSDQIFDETVQLIEAKLSLALKDILRQDIKLKVLSTWHMAHGSEIQFAIERNGEREDILRGQGGSVINILTAGLRLFVLRQLDEQSHRGVLFLDEPDAWLRPELVPRLVRMIGAAARELNFQVVLISHHDEEFFRDEADLIYEFVPAPDGTVTAREKFRREGVEPLAMPELPVETAKSPPSLFD